MPTDEESESQEANVVSNNEGHIRTNNEDLTDDSDFVLEEVAEHTNEMDIKNGEDDTDRHESTEDIVSKPDVAEEVEHPEVQMASDGPVDEHTSNTGDEDSENNKIEDNHGEDLNSNSAAEVRQDETISTSSHSINEQIDSPNEEQNDETNIIKHDEL